MPKIKNQKYNKHPFMPDGVAAALEKKLKHVNKKTFTSALGLEIQIANKIANKKRKYE